MCPKVDHYFDVTTEFRQWLEKNYCVTSNVPFESIITQDGIFNPSAYFSNENRVLFLLLEDYEKDDHWPCNIEDIELRDNKRIFGWRSKGDCSQSFAKNIISAYNAYCSKNVDWKWTDNAAKDTESNYKAHCSTVDASHLILDGVAFINIKKRKNAIAKANPSYINSYIFESSNTSYLKTEIDERFYRGWSVPPYDNVIPGTSELATYKQFLVQQIEACDPTIVFACGSTCDSQFSRALELFGSNVISVNRPDQKLYRKKLGIYSGKQSLARIHNTYYKNDFWLISWKHPSGKECNSKSSPEFYKTLEKTWNL